MTIYIDNDYKCYTSYAEGRRAVDTDVFDGKCEEWIESYRYVLAGEMWARADGTTFTGEMISPWKDLGDAYVAQSIYLANQNKQYDDALTAIEEALS